MASHYPSTQPEEPSSEHLDNDPDSEGQIDKAAEIIARKTFYRPTLPMSYESSSEEPTPDLHEYFSDFDMSATQIIAYCRRFASALAAAVPRKRRKRSEK